MFDGRIAVAPKAAEQTVADATPSVHPHGPELPDMSGSYGRYISSGLYDRRYSRPNRRTLRKMKRRLPASGRFLDVGAGTGRYTLPLLQMSGTRCVAHDICPVARETLAERLRDFVSDERLVIRGDDPDDLAAELPQAFDLALLAFGVLAHVARRTERLRLLRAIRTMLKADGTLILSVPNAKRRFLKEQRDAEPLVREGTLEPGDVLYKRNQANGEIRLFYHLYTLDEVHRRPHGGRLPRRERRGREPAVREKGRQLPATRLARRLGLPVRAGGSWLRPAGRRSAEDPRSSIRIFHTTPKKIFLAIIGLRYHLWIAAHRPILRRFGGTSVQRLRQERIARQVPAGRGGSGSLPARRSRPLAAGVGPRCRRRPAVATARSHRLALALSRHDPGKACGLRWAVRRRPT